MPPAREATLKRNMTTNEVLPERMDRWSQNRRLNETLKGMGLYVSPIPEPADSTKIRDAGCRHLPFECGAQQAAQRSIPGAMQGSQIRNAVVTEESDRGNVVDFPSVL
jgi:hypothetical protein